MSSDVLLRTEGLRKVFKSGAGLALGKAKEVVAVSGADIDVVKGETLAIVGESGSGKSTVARLMLRLIDPTAGRVEFRGQDLTGLKEKRMRGLRRHLQMVFQDPYASLHPRRTCFGLISEGWRIHPDVVAKADFRTRAEGLMAQVGLPLDYMDMYPSRLSGGERQRVAIARALALEPELLVLDEPVSALDVSIQAQVVKLVMSLQERLNLTFVFISHDLSLVRLVSDRVVVMRRGDIVEQGPTAEVYADPQNDHTKHLLSAAPERKQP
ncbi:MAG: ATP-binding cassette domain-containing protein [Propionibacteriaceae bacterium]|jgi:ABC-type glutathione transport system ATPase component|nr:ATP-binding cassette domain-containing protein [Propionibacteriaceae bacterium]